MFKIDEDKTIHLTRGDMAQLEISTKDPATGSDHTFKKDDKVRLTVCEKGDYGKVVLRKEVVVSGETTVVDMVLDGNETKIGDIISKSKEYWYEIEVNPGPATQTIIGHDEDGPKKFMLYPEGSDGDES